MDVGAAPPDVLVAKNWNYANRNNSEINYLATVEIKSPDLDPIFNRNKNEYSWHTQNEVKEHLKASSNVILTDCLRWHFFDQENKLETEKIFDLFDKENNVWKNKVVNNEGFLSKEFCSENSKDDEPDEWKNLCKYITEKIIK